MCNINNLAAKKTGNDTTHTDEIMPIIGIGKDAGKNPLPYLVGRSKEDFLKYFIKAAHKKNVTVSIEFGGDGATQDDWTLPGDPATVAGNLAKFMTEYGIDSVSFDVS